tara:strand:- start:451 stop:708 length:258 start_codon:yes stop_codon:yes gene_type:complete
MGADIPDNSVDMPLSVSYLWELHRDIRFSLFKDVKDGDTINVLSPRESLSLGGVIQYAKYMGLDLNRTEIGAIMSIDSIYDRYAR